MQKDSIGVIKQMKKFFYFEAIISVNKKLSLSIYFASRFFGRKNYLYKKLIAILFSLLCFSNTFSALAYAQEMLTTQSPEVAVGFSKDGKLLQTLSSKYLAVGVNNPTPSLLSSDPESLPPLEGERELTIYGGNFVKDTKVYLHTEGDNYIPLNTEIQSLNELKTKATLQIMRLQRTN